LEGKVARSVGMLSKLKYLLPRTTLQQLYYAVIHPSLLFGIIWGLVSYKIKHWEPFVELTHRDSASPAPIYAKIKILKIVDLHKY